VSSAIRWALFFQTCLIEKLSLLILKQFTLCSLLTSGPLKGCLIIVRQGSSWRGTCSGRLCRRIRLAFGVFNPVWIVRATLKKEVEGLTLRNDSHLRIQPQWLTEAYILYHIHSALRGHIRCKVYICSSYYTSIRERTFLGKLNRTPHPVDCNFQPSV
jgi:hypothetical protein